MKRKGMDADAFLADLDAKGIPYTLGPSMMPDLSVGDTRPVPINPLSGPDDKAMQDKYSEILARAFDVDPEIIIVKGVHEGEPLGKQRPRFSKKTGRVYTPRTTKEHEQELADIALAQLPQDQQSEKEWAYGIRAKFYVQTHQRKDVDNMLKCVLDALNGLAFADDAQVRELMGWKQIDCLRPRTEFIVYRLHKIDKDIGQCVKCGVVFRRYKSWKSRLFCSRRCFGISIQKKIPCTCCHCGNEFLRTPIEIDRSKGGKLYCSNKCNYQHNRRNITCALCGSPISRPNSWSKKDQKDYYCNRSCLSKAKTGKPVNATSETLSARSRKAWLTRKQKSTLLVEGGKPDA